MRKPRRTRTRARLRPGPRAAYRLDYTTLLGVSSDSLPINRLAPRPGLVWGGLAVSAGGHREEVRPAFAVAACLHVLRMRVNTRRLFSDRAKTADTRAVWQRIAATFSKAAGAAALAIGAGLVAPTPAQAFNIIPSSARACNTHCVQRRKKGSRTTAFAQALAMTLGMNSDRCS